MRAILKASAVTESQPCFVNQGSRLQGVSDGFAGHLLPRHIPQFHIDAVEQGFGSSAITAADGGEKQCNLVQ